MSKRYILISFFFIISYLNASDKYEVQFKGSVPEETLSRLKESSQLIELHDTPYTNISGLRRRADRDAQKLVRVLHSKAYYSAAVDISIDKDHVPILVTIEVKPGPIYTFAEFLLTPSDSEAANYEEQANLYSKINFNVLNITLGKPAYPKDIIEAEENVLLYLAKQGYCHAMIKKRDVIADQTKHTITVALYLNSGPKTYFGPVSISGLSKVKESVITKKICWQEGYLYNPVAIERTTAALESSGLFSSIAITPAEELSAENRVPVHIEVKESKSRSIGAGVAYATQRGPGMTAEWENRNLRGVGEKLSFTTTLWSDLQDAILLLTQPDYRCRGQDLLWIAEMHHETTKGYTESSLSLSSILEKQINTKTKISYGLTYKRLRDTHAANDGNFNLMKTPLHIRWNNANNLLDPTSGISLIFKSIPSLQFLNSQFAYCINTLSYGVYMPLKKNHRVVFATKLTVGSIFGGSIHAIPSSEMFYEGSDNTLRGYQYQTVSPLNGDDKPVGGRSLLVTTNELRMRSSETLGWVLFYDLGNVFRKALPDLDHRMLQSAGAGIRYHTPVGPLRCDIAFPLNRRKHLDPRFQIYLSVGQTF